MPNIDLLEEHRQKYKEFCAEQVDQKQELEDYWNYDLVLEQLRDDPIHCVKYNYCLDAEIQNF